MMHARRRWRKGEEGDEGYAEGVAEGVAGGVWGSGCRGGPGGGGWGRPSICKLAKHPKQPKQRSFAPSLRLQPLAISHSVATPHRGRWRRTDGSRLTMLGGEPNLEPHQRHRQPRRRRCHRAPRAPHRAPCAAPGAVYRTGRRVPHRCLACLVCLGRWHGGAAHRVGAGGAP